MSKTITVYEGKVRRNIYGNWSDIDHGWWIGDDCVTNFLSDMEDSRVKVTVEVLPSIVEDDN